MNKRHKIIKISSVILGLIISIAVIIILLISPITKHVIEKYDIQYTGRKITMDRVYVNPFTGYFHFSNLKVYELNSDSIFFKAKSVNVNVAIHKLPGKTVEITSLTLNQPDIMVDKKDKEFNFSDLIRKLTPPKKKAKPSNIHVNILGIKINDGIIHYRDNSVPVNYFIKNVSLYSPGKRWDLDTIAVRYSFQSGTRKGDLNGDFSMDVKKLNYNFIIVIHQLDLKILEPFIKDLKNYGTFSANLETNLKAKGNFKDANDVTFAGMLAINKFHFGKNPKVDYGSFDKLQLAIYQLSPKDKKYLFDSVSLTHPYFKYERYNRADNIQKMFGKSGANHQSNGSTPGNFNLLITIGNYIAVLSKNFFHSDYKINRLALYNGNFIYNDYSLSEKFGLEMTQIHVLSDSIDKNQKRANVTFKSSIIPSGNINIGLSINPKDSGDFDLNYHFRRIPATLFNPYLISLTSYPLDRGIIELNGVWHVRNSIIQSDNHLQIIDPRVAERTHNKDTKWLPMWLVMAIVRDRGNVIDYRIPITGNLKNPTFHLKVIVVKALENIIVKPVTTPYRIMVKNIEAEIEKSLTLKWEMNQIELQINQKKFIHKMVDFLSKNPEASIVIHPQLYVTKEKEYLLLFEAKKKYFMNIHHKNSPTLNINDSTLIENMSIKDNQFVHYLNLKIKDPLVFTVQGKSELLIGSKIIDRKLAKLKIKRETAFLLDFKKKGVDKQVKFSPSLNVIPFNGYSFYKITYKGELPESLLKAYNKMNKLNNREPRKEYKKDRKKSIKNLFQK